MQAWELTLQQEGTVQVVKHLADMCNRLRTMCPRAVLHQCNRAAAETEQRNRAATERCNSAATGENRAVSLVAATESCGLGGRASALDYNSTISSLDQVLAPLMPLQYLALILQYLAYTRFQVAPLKTPQYLALWSSLHQVPSCASHFIPLVSVYAHIYITLTQQ